MKPAFTAFFLAFTILYVYHFQPFVLEMIQYAWSGGKTHYDPLIGAVIITGVMCLVSVLTAFLTKFPQRLFSFVFFPAFLLLGLLAAVEVHGTTVSTSTVWLVLSPVLLLLFCCFASAARRFQPFLVPLRSTALLSQPWWTNALAMSLMAMLTYAMGNTDRTLHTRLVVEDCLEHGLYSEALGCGFPQYDNDSSLTMLRAIALANTEDASLKQPSQGKTPQNQLGNRLFHYEITGSSNSLLPRADRSVAFLLGDGATALQTIGIRQKELSVPAVDFLEREVRKHSAKPALRDYLLCAYLIDRDLDKFAATLPKYYAINDSLPTHYREAIVLYRSKTHKEIPSNTEDQPLADTAMEADFADFLALMRKQQRDAVLRNSLLRDSYFGTYWYYYYVSK